MLNGMLWINHSGAQWRAEPKRYGPWSSVYARFAKWVNEGLWERIFAELNQDADTENLSIDSTCVKVHESSNGGEKTENKAIGRTKGGLNTKIHAIVDGLGNPVAFLLSPGNENDSTHAIELMSMTDISGSNLLADKAYGTQKFSHVSRNMMPLLWYRPKAMQKNRDQWIITYTKSATLLSASFRKSSGFVVLLQGMINLTALFLLLFIWRLSWFGYFDYLFTFFKQGLAYFPFLPGFFLESNSKKTTA